MIILVALFSITTVFTVYAISAYSVASHVHELFGRLMWSSIPGGSFLPWPSYSEIGFPAFTPVSEIDSLYYQFFIESWMLGGIAVLLWAVSIVFCVASLLKNKE